MSYFKHLCSTLESKKRSVCHIELIIDVNAGYIAIEGRVRLLGNEHFHGKVISGPWQFMSNFWLIFRPELWICVQNRWHTADRQSFELFETPVQKSITFFDYRDNRT